MITKKLPARTKGKNKINPDRSRRRIRRSWSSRGAVEPEHDGVEGRITLRQHQVVEQPPAIALVHGYVPGVVFGWEGAVEAREVGHEVLLWSCNGERDEG